MENGFVIFDLSTMRIEGLMLYTQHCGAGSVRARCGRGAGELGGAVRVRTALQLGRHVVQRRTLHAERCIMRVCVSMGRQGRPGSVGGRLLVLRVVHGEEVFELPLQGLEGGPFEGILVPTLQHDFVEGRQTILRARHAVPVFHLV